MKTPFKSVIFCYYAIYAIILIIVALGSYCTPKTPWINADATVIRVIYSILVLYLLFSIPLTLKWFHNNIKKIKQLTDEQKKIERYTKDTYIVLAIISFGLLASLICFYLFKEQSYIYMAGIEIIALLFCKPTGKRMINDLLPEEDKETTSENEPTADDSNKQTKNE
ncbi:MAG: hypothetical protein EOM76_09170 [Sphingobacteriia bacterium]|nr:hypothetical protein [Sphingobacteriia bacterium]